MSAKIKLCLYQHLRNSIPSLTGRSGKIYGRAHFNEREMRHETPEFDLEEYQTIIQPDLVKFPSTLRWWPVVTVEAGSDAEKKLKEELAAAKARIAELEAAAKTGDPFAGFPLAGLPVQPESAPASAEKSLADLGYRELRAKCKEQKIAVTATTTKEEMIALLSAPEPEEATLEV
jgi:hypothetical protein